jgi:hypothetical protein
MRVRWDASEFPDESLKMAKIKIKFLIYNHPTVTVDSASSLCASPLPLCASL